MFEEYSVIEQKLMSVFTAVPLNPFLPVKCSPTLNCVLPECCVATLHF
jgi:hypothetical protein